MQQVAIVVGAAFDFHASSYEPDNPHIVRDARYWPLDMKRAIGAGPVRWYGRHEVSTNPQISRTVYGSKKLGGLSTRMDTVISALIRAIERADTGQHKDDWKFFCAVDRLWGRQPNRIVRPYTRKKKKR